MPADGDALETELALRHAPDGRPGKEDGAAWKDDAHGARLGKANGV